MAQKTQQQQQKAPGAQSGKPVKNSPQREGDEPQDLREAKPNQKTPESKDRGRDRTPGDMRRDENDQNESDMQNEPRGTGFDESKTPLGADAGDTADTDDTDEDETDSQGGSHMKNPQPRTR